MLETGKVIEIRGDRVKVSLPLKEGCSACGRCTLSRGGKYMRLEVENIAGARMGDEVMVEVPRRDPLVAALLLFGLPLLGLLAGVVAGTLLEKLWGWDSEAPAVVLGVFLLVASFFLVKIREKRLSRKKRGQIRIVRVL